MWPQNGELNLHLTDEMPLSVSLRFHVVLRQFSRAFLVVQMVRTSDDEIEREIEREISSSIDRLILSIDDKPLVLSAEEAVLFLASFVIRKS